MIKGAGSNTVLYMTWARKHSPEHQKLIAEAYNSIGQKVGATVVPVGLAWENFLAKHDKPVLHDRDQSHPTIAGSYLAACVFLVVLFKQSPVGIKCQAPGLTVEEASALQRATWKQLGRKA